MIQRPVNPFTVTKASELTDQQILVLWVDYPEAYGNLLKPTSRMPMFVLGAKGSGKTHLLRYSSVPLQALRAESTFSERIRTEGYVGVYERLGALNARRFAGKGQASELWEELYAYYIDLWLGQSALNVAGELLSDLTVLERETAEPELVANVLRLFDVSLPSEITTVGGLIDALVGLRSQLDYQCQDRP